MPSKLATGELAADCPFDFERRPRREEVVTSEWDRADSCAPVELTGAAPCEWVCAVRHGGWCGNGGSWDLLVLLEDRGGWFGRLGRIALADHGPASFHRTIWIERRGRRHTIVARLV
jgi:hypothetical protein